MKRKSSPPLVAVADHRQRKKSRRRTAAIDTELPFLLTNNPIPHLLVTEVFYTPPSHNPCAFNRRGAIIAVPLDGDAATAARYTSAPIRRRGRLVDLYRRCMPFLGATPRGGRLAFAGSRGVFLVNPVTDALQGFNTMGYCQNAVLAAGASGGGGDCGIFVSLGAVLAPPALWRVEDDGERWSECPLAATGEQTGDVVAAVSCGGKGCCFYYLLHENGSVSRVDAGEPPPLRMEKLPVASLLDNFYTPCGETMTLPGEAGHLLECDGEVLFVRKLLAVREIAALFCAHAEFVGVVGFEVYRLDVAARRWEKVELLPGDTAVFVSPQSAFAVRASETAAVAARVMGNCVYFVGESRCCFVCGVYGASTWGAYSMEERKVLFEHAVASRGGRTEALWFLPSAV
ncbi:unnamed protein product [Urochloa humidicola]